jgi:site-specific recombinase XerD
MKKHYRRKWSKKRNYPHSQYFLKNCNSLPRPIEPKDAKQILKKIRGKPRDKAMILVLLRTGMRICELLTTKIQDINLRERKILIFESAKNRIGRVVYLSEDARVALRKWMKIRKQQGNYLFHGHCGGPLSYEAARSVFKKYTEKAGLSHKGYTLHCLRHTFASELLSAGMPLESLQYLMGHSSIVVTRRYARLTNIALEKDYFDAMCKIEKGEEDGFYGNDYEI